MPPRRPQGNALSSDPAALDRAAVITPDDVQRAREQWRQDAPTAYRALLDATPQDPRPAGV